MTITITCYKMKNCAPCKMLAPVIEDVCKEHNVELKILDVHEYQSAAVLASIKSAPTTIVYKDGKEIDRFSGALPRSKLVERIITPYT